MKNNRPPILQSDWSIASRHGRNTIMTLSLIIIRDIHYYFYSTKNISIICFTTAQCVSCLSLFTRTRVPKCSNFTIIIILCFYYNFTLYCKYPTNTTHFLYTSIPSHDNLCSIESCIIDLQITAV